MVSEDQARDLLARAGATIDVDEHAPMTLTGLPEERRRWPLLLAIAASVAVVAGLGYGAARLVGNGGSEPVSAVAGDPLEKEHVAADDEMPSLLGYTEAEAKALLTRRGVKVRSRPVPDGCNVPGIVVGASPAAGAALAGGDVVTLRVTEPHDVVDCVGEPDWEDLWGLMRFARGLGTAPDLAGQVRLAVVAGGDVVATAESGGRTLQEPSAWTICDEDGCHSPLGGLAQMLSDPATWLGPGSPYVSVTQGPRCLPGGAQEWLDAGWTYHLWVEVPVDGVFCPATSLLIRRDESGAIDAVTLRLPAGSEASDITEPELEAGLARMAAARQFVEWARGDGPAPDFADRVRLFAPGFSSPWKHEPERRDTWSGCSGLGFPDCPIDPIGTLVRHDGRVVPAPGLSTCPASGPAPDGYPESDVVRLSGPEPATCDGAWAVELWISEAGEIYAVRQVQLSR